MRIEYTAEARLDLLEGLEYYESQQEGLAAEFYDEFTSAESDVLDLPEFWHPFGNGYRRKHLKRFPYSIVYQLKYDNLILVVAVANSNKEQSYWEG